MQDIDLIEIHIFFLLGLGKFYSQPLEGTNVPIEESIQSGEAEIGDNATGG